MKKRNPFLSKNWFRIGLAVAFAGSFAFSAFAQNGPAKQWDKTFGGSGWDSLLDLQLTLDGGFIVGGHSNSGISGDKSQASLATDFWVLKLNSSGNKIWDRTYGGNDNDGLSSLQQTSDGGFILGGGSRSNISGDKSQISNGMNDFWIIKLDSLGNKQWDKAFGGSNNEGINSIMQTADGGYILGGSSDSNISGDKSQACRGNFDYWVVKLDSNGNKIWDKTFGGSYIDRLYVIKQTSDGGFILGGESYSDLSGDKSQSSRGFNDFWILKLDAYGNKVWDKTLGGNGIDQLNSISQTNDGGYILGGYSSSDVSGEKSQANKGGIYTNDYWIIKLDPNGQKLWDRTIGGIDDDAAFSLIKTTDNGYLVGGDSKSNLGVDKTQISNGINDFWITKLDSNGNKVWDKTIGGSSNEHLTSMKQTTDNGFIIAGESFSGISGDKSQPSQGERDFWIVKLAADITGIKEPKINFNLSISPNPNQGKFTLQLSNFIAPKAAVTVSDLLGRVVLQQQLNVSKNQLSEELTLPYAKGMYLLQVKAGEQIITRKIVVE